MTRSSFSNSKSKILMSSLYTKNACEGLVISDYKFHIVELLITCNKTLIRILSIKYS